MEPLASEALRLESLFKIRVDASLLFLELYFSVIYWTFLIVVASFSVGSSEAWVTTRLSGLSSSSGGASSPSPEVALLEVPAALNIWTIFTLVLTAAPIFLSLLEAAENLSGDLTLRELPVLASSASKSAFISGKFCSSTMASLLRCTRTSS